ncbi:hypothetical protein JXQ70_09690 [bacterium]|nr:hypothetical protein [bacterium]
MAYKHTMTTPAVLCQTRRDRTGSSHGTYRHTAVVRFVLVTIICSGFLTGCHERRPLEQSPLEVRIDPDRIAAIVTMLETRAAVFTGVQGRFAARVIKPGLDFTFRGAFRAAREGQTRLEIYSPMGMVTHVLVLDKDTFRFISAEEGELSGLACEPVERLYDQWGLTIMPYQLLALFSGSYIEPLFYEIQEGSALDRLLVKVDLRCVRNGAVEHLFIDPVQTVMVRRQLRLSHSTQPVNIAYFYPAEGAGGQSDPADLSSFPERLVISQERERVRIQIDFSDIAEIGQETL